MAIGLWWIFRLKGGIMWASLIFGSADQLRAASRLFMRAEPVAGAWLITLETETETEKRVALTH